MAVDARVCDLELEHSELSDVASAAAAERAALPPSLSSRSVAQRTDATLAKKEADARAHEAAALDHAVRQHVAELKAAAERAASLESELRAARANARAAEAEARTDALAPSGTRPSSQQRPYRPLRSRATSARRATRSRASASSRAPRRPRRAARG